MKTLRRMTTWMLSVLGAAFVLSGCVTGAGSQGEHTTGAALMGVPLDARETLAEQGNADAQFNLGYRYLLGAWVPQDEEKSLYWLKLAATQGHLDAAYLLLLARDDATPQWQQVVERAAQQGNRRAMEMLVSLGEEKWEPQLIAALQQAAQAGDARALMEMGMRYERGEGVVRDEDKGLAYLRQAAQTGFPLAMMVLNKAADEKVYTDDEVIAAFKQRVASRKADAADFLLLAVLDGVEFESSENRTLEDKGMVLLSLSILTPEQIPQLYHDGEFAVALVIHRVMLNMMNEKSVFDDTKVQALIAQCLQKLSDACY